jgi:Nuclease-related domain
MPNVIENILKKALPIFVMGAPAIFMLVFIFTFSQVILYRNRKRKNPLTGQKLLRSPGETLLGVISDLQFKIMEVVFFWCVLPPLIYSMSLGAIAAEKSATLLFTALVAAILISLYGAVRAYIMLKRLFDFRLAYDGELSVGQELNGLMLDGFRVYHDIKAEDFNIDHAVVGPPGVFAIETKTRSKKINHRATRRSFLLRVFTIATKVRSGQLQAEKEETVEVLYDGDSINFPHWKDTKILEQAKGNARWLERKLTAAVGHKVSVFPTVAIPGWYTKKTTNKSGPIVYNGKHPRVIFQKCGQKNHLTEEHVQRIAYQLEQLCRNVEPLTFKRKKKFGT